MKDVDEGIKRRKKKCEEERMMWTKELKEGRKSVRKNEGWGQKI